MKRKNVEYDYVTDRETVKNIDFEQLLEDFQKQSRERNKRKKGNKKHK